MKASHELTHALDEALGLVKVPGFADAVRGLIEEAESPGDAVDALRALGDSLLLALTEAEEAITYGTGH